jgi:hypothetical protein
MVTTHLASTITHSLTQLLVVKQLAEGLAESGRNSILIVPLASQNQPSDHHARITAHFAEFSARILMTLQRVGFSLATKGAESTNVGRISFASSSGGCYPLQDILRQNDVINPYRSLIQEIFLFDSVYEPTPFTFSSFSGRLWVTYSEHKENRALRILRARNARGDSCLQANWYANRATPVRADIQSSTCGFVSIGPGDQFHAAHIPSLFGRLLVPALNRAH